MSNIDFDPRHIPDPAEVIGRAQRSAIGSVATSVDDNPDDVARALDISKATGTPASVVYGDLEHHEMKLKTNISTDLIRNNPDLLDYVNSHPLAAQLSNDDWGNLDTASQSMSRLRKGFFENTGDVLKDTLHFFQTGPEQYTEIANQTRASLLKQGVSPIQADAIAKNAGASAYRGEVLQNVLFAIPTMLLSPAIGAFRTYVANPIEESTGFPAQATEGYTMVALAALGMKGLNHNRVVETANKIDPYMRSGKEPPVGVDSIIDELKIQQGETEVDALIDAIKESQPSLTKERNPDMYADFAEQHVGDQSIGIHADAIRGLYGDKPSAWDDAMLGFVPGLDEKLITAEATGGYVDIPMAEYIAKVEPEVAKALEDFTRVRQGGVSKGEAKDIKASVEVPDALPPERAVETVRDVGALAPKERKLELKRAAESEVPKGWDRADLGVGDHMFVINDAEGKTLGDLAVSEEAGGKRLYIDDIRGIGGVGANSLGPRQLRDLLQQLKAEFPHAEELTGYRVSGDRDKAGTWETKGKVSIKLAAEKTPFEKGMEDFVQKNNLPEISDQQRIDNIKQRIGQIERDRRAGGKPEEGYPPHAELLGLRRRLRELQGDQGFSIKLAEPTAADNLFQILLDDRIERLGEESELGGGFTATTIPDNRWQNFERSIVKTVDAEIAKLGISDVDVEAAHKIVNEKGELVRGLYQSYENARPTILFAITADDPVGVLRHEVLHDLRTRGFLDEKEWGVLEHAAGEEAWIEKYDIRTRYPDLDEAGWKEEAIADEFADWRRKGKPADSLYAKVFQKIDQLIEAIRSAMRQLFGTENWKDIFDKIESGEVAGREPTTEFGDGTKEAKQPELPGTRRMEDRDVFAEAQAAGMTVDQYKRYMKLIAERHREDLRLESERALKDAKRRQTEKWKSDYAELRPQVTEEINERPDIATDNLLREQRLFGRKTDQVQLGSEYLTVEQKAALPKDYVAKGGAHPDDVAALTGYETGTELVQGLAALDAARKASGLRPIEFTRRLIASETERQMESKYGKLGDNILDEAKEQVLSETQLDLLHEEVLAAGLKAGAEFPITKQQMKDWVAERFAGEAAKDISSDKFLADAGRAGRMAEDALLKGDPAEAFRQKQRQYLAVAMTRLAKDFEKAQAQFDTLAERMIRKEPKGYDKDFVNFAQGMLARSGYNIKRNLNELADSLQRSGFTSFDEFVQSKIGDGWELSVAEDLRQGSGKPIEKMTTQEFMDLKESLDSLAHVAREVGKIDIAGQKLDFAEWKEGVLENIRSLPVRDKDKPVKQRLRFDASMTRMEEIAKDLDLRKELGPLFNALIRPMVESKHTEYSMLEDLSKKLREMKGDRAWQRSLKDTIPQDFFHDPYDATLFDLTRQDMIQIMLNFGNRSNIEKFTRGYVGKEEAPGFEAKLWDMIHKNANKEDWEFVQKVWDIFDGWKAQSGKLYYDLSGRQPKWIDPSPITTPHGEFAGGYYPIIYDRLRSNINAIEEKVSPNALFGSNYFRASPANHYAKERTGYADRIQFQTSIEQVAGRMQQLIHDVSYRRAVMDASKVIYDREIRAEIRKHYGMEYEKQLDPWLKDIANHFNNDEVANDFASAVMRRARANLVGHALGLNLKVILSPAVAKMNPMDAMRVWTDYKASSELAYEKSFEIPHTFRNIDRDFRERLEAAIARGGWNEYQAAAVRWAFMPVVKVEQQFRIITFVNEYQKALAKGMSEGDASVLADSYVRERHGSTGLPDMPAIMRSSEGMKIATMFYGYFSAMYNWQRQIPGNISRGEWKDGLANFWGAVAVPAAFGAVLFNQSKESDSWGKQIAKALVLQPLSTLVFIRDFANFYIEGNPSRTPLATAAAAVSSIISDTKNYHEGKKIKKPIQHIGNVIGLSTGLPMAQLSRTTQFAADVTKGEQRPRNIAEWARGIITGEARLKK